MRSSILIAALAGTAALAATIARTPDDGSRERASAPLKVVRGAALASPPREPAPLPAPASASPRSQQTIAAADWWRPAVTDTWQWQLTGQINTTYDAAIYDIDLFDAPDGVIARLHADGRRIVCYFSAGSSENWRSDFGEFKPADMGKPLDGWVGERWLDVRSRNVRRIMRARLDLAAARGCDGVEPDNVDGYANRNGLDLSDAKQLDYNRFLAREAHRRGLAIALKNDLDQVAALADSFDFAVNEQCHQYRECDRLGPFTDASKPVFNAEYRAKYRDDAAAREALCAASAAANIRTLVLPLNLNDRYRLSCD